MIEVIAKLAAKDPWTGAETPMPEVPQPPPVPGAPSQATPPPPAQPLTPEQRQQQREADVAKAEAERQQQNAPGFWDNADSVMERGVKNLAPAPIYEHFKKNKPLYYTLGSITALGGLGGLIGGRKARKFLWPLALLGGLGLAATAYHGYQQWQGQPWYKKAWQGIKSVF